MKRWLALVAFVLPLAGCTFDYQALLAAVQPLQFHVTDTSGKLIFINRCTAGLINTERHLWLTAAHCLASPDDLPGATVPEFFIDEHLAQVVMVSVFQDLAVVSTVDRFEAHAIPLASKRLQPGDWVGTVGYPLGLGQAYVFWGSVANMRQGFSKGHDFTIFQLVNAPGQSGSPIVNRRGELVSVAQASIAYDPIFEPVVGGATWEDLKAFAGQFFEWGRLHTLQRWKQN